jgi:hypothetical protein
MRGLILAAAAIGLAIWSLFAWAVYGLLGYAGELAAGGAFMFPLVPPELLYWTASVLGGMGGVIVWVVWAVGAGLIVLLAMIPLAFLRRAPQRRDRASEALGADSWRSGGETPRR